MLDTRSQLCAEKAAIETARSSFKRRESAFAALFLTVIIANLSRLLRESPILPIFAIEPSDIQALDDTAARELVARLAMASLLANGLPESAVTWGGDQRAADGGVDVRVSATQDLAFGGFVPSSSTVFQVKAESFSAAKILKEMLPKAQLREEIAALGATGAYVIVSSKDNCSDSSLNSRLSAMTAALETIAIDTRPTVHFYDARQLANWVERHPAVAVWMRQKLGKPLTGWRPFGPWANQQADVNEPYLVDDAMARVVLADQQPGTITAAFSSMRTDLSAGRAVRLVGLSGVGKTRFAIALFQEIAGVDTPALSPSTAVYADLSDNPDPLPQTIMENLLIRGDRANLIVDNCGQATHSRSC